jgi:S-adenosyl methyltransferase
MEKDAAVQAPDITQPSIARAYDYLLGGKGNFAGDPSARVCYVDNDPMAVAHIGDLTVHLIRGASDACSDHR